MVEVPNLDHFLEEEIAKQVKENHDEYYEHR